ncbi:type II toxin-antitoxin system RelE/ParE family toxin [Rhizobium sp. 0TCS1.26]|uniref:type II toxin-antitoxin system RelE/ParE family toxin n=1 Tax=Rhizobium sp. 0TCS1.26 TaxID=3142623 RepID=UPI003D2B7497
MISRVLFHPVAEADLEQIYHFIAADSPQRAIAFVRRIRSFCDDLEAMPERGRSRNDLAPGVRTHVLKRRVIVAYRLQDGVTTILRIYYAGQNIDSSIWPKD